MRKQGILNAEICKVIAAIGHTEYLVIADPGLPIPDDIKVIDISLKHGVPGFVEVLDSVVQEMVVDSFIYAAEMEEYSPRLLEKMRNILVGVPEKKVTHENLKEMLSEAKAIIRTGECTSYANVILEGGVNF